MRFWFPLTLALLAAPAAAQQPLIAPTDPLTPEQERNALVVPPGFEVQLVAAEPDIQKPIQMAFDAKGRIWVTTSYHYPFAAEKGKASDKLFVLSDIGPDGKAKKVQVFADTLNIPIGILPLPDCNSCIVSSVGEILKLTDTDGDGKADKTEVLFTGFGSRDTHGMYNSFTLMPDGWVYACHGFSNDSTVRGKDGHEVKMQSGHTFRFRPDGSRIEVYTRGQVNPFGMAVDPWFNLYTADCHSKPITQLIPGAYYDSFGKPHDGLGYAPHVTRHDHGSTALCGLTWYDADQFPKEYRGRMFLGNVVTNRVNADVIEWHGSSPVAKEQPDFVVSKDPWFRPADIKLGPDGALYITDFYNKIIGHYEVPLTHPARDKDRGRVWRVIWKGTKDNAPPPKMPFTDMTKATVPQLVELLEHPNLTVRLLAADQFLYRKGNWWDEFPHQKLPTKANVKSDARVYVPYPMLAEHAGIVKDEHEISYLFALVFGEFSNPAALDLAVGIARGLATRPQWGDEARSIALMMLRGPEKPDPMYAPVYALLRDPKIRRAVIDAFIFHPHRLNAKPLVEFIKAIPPEDNHLKFAARVALRNTLRDAGEAWGLVPAPDSADAAIVADVALAVPDAKAADYLAKYVAAQPNPPRLPETVEHIARYGSDDARDVLVKAAREAKDWRKQHAIVAALRKGVAARGQQLRPAEQQVAKGVVTTGLASPDPAAVQAGCELAGALRLPETGTVLADIAADKRKPEAVRLAAVNAAVAVDPGLAPSAVAPVVIDPAAPVTLREKAAQALGAVPTPAGITATRAALKTVPYRVGVGLATGMAGSKPGAEALLAAVKAGEGSPRLLQEKPVLERLRAAGLPGWEQRVAELTKGLPPADQQIAAFIRQRAAQFTGFKPDKEAGAKLFAKHCGACHQIGGQGGKVGPNLDGVGIRGLDRLLEDVLDPNRNVDQAFRAKVLSLNNGTTKTGLLLRTEGQVLVMADDQGKEYSVPKSDVDAIRETTLSPMPANFGTVVPEAEFHQIVAYLLDQKVKDPPKK